MATALAGIIGLASHDRSADLVRRMLERMKREPGSACEVMSAPELGMHVGSVSWNRSRGASPEDSPSPMLMLAGDVRLPCDVSAGSFDDVASTARAILGQYRSVGPSFVERLNGLFAGVLIDKEAGAALVFNDRYGAERIYVHREDGLTYFASEAKALLAVLPHLRAFDDAGLRDYFRYGSTLCGRTLFREISTLPGATLWRIHGVEGHIEESRYFDPSQWEAQETLSGDAFMESFSSVFHRILPSYLTSPEHIGVSITGGLDTRMIMACLPDRQAPGISYTYAGQSGETLDCRIGARVASVRGIEHRVLRIGRDFLKDYRNYVDRTVFSTDGSAGALQAHEIYFSALAKELAPIRLTGNFGSEVLRSISTFKPMGLDRALFDPQVFDVPPGTATGEAELAPAHPVTHAAFREIPWHLFGTVRAARQHLVFRTPYLDNEVVRLAYTAPRELRHSSEPAFRLLRDHHPKLSSIATDRGISARPSGPWTIARRAAAEITFKLDYVHKEGMPNWLSPFDAAFGTMSAVGLLGWHKFLPYRVWFRQELASSIADAVYDARKLGFFSSDYLASVAPAHVQGRRNHLPAIHTIATLEAVDRLLLRDNSPP